MQADTTDMRRRVLWLLAIVLAPLAYLMLMHAAIPQDKGYHMLADARTCLGVPNFGNVLSNLAFLLVGAIGWQWCRRHLQGGARASWQVFFAGVALVFCGSAYYHAAPGNATLVWDRLPMTVAFMALLVALLSEHLETKVKTNIDTHRGASIERALLLPALMIGVASVLWWHYSDDLRLYIWVQAAPLLAIPLVLAMFPARYSHRIYLLYGVGFYVLAKVFELWDERVFEATGQWVSGHSLKHLLAAGAPLMLLLMLRRRAAVT